MVKTKLGITIGLMGAALYAAALFGGYVPAILLAGYVLLMEENEWLKRTAVKAVALLAGFSFLVYVINVIPDVVGWVLSFINLFGTSLYLSELNAIFSVLTSAVSIAKDLVFLFLIVKSLKLATVKVPVVDPLVDKNM